MKTLQSYEFTDATLRIDLLRIIREAEGTEVRRGRSLPAVIRVTVNETGNEVMTLVHRECFEGFTCHGEEQTVNRVVKAPRYSVVPGICVVRKDGDRGVYGPPDDNVSEWLLLIGDYVKEFTDRIHVKVEVF